MFVEPGRVEVPAILGIAPHKVFAPSIRADCLDRPRVAELLQQRDTKVVQLVAGAGFGKTTALTQLAMTDERPVAWLSLDRGDDDPVRLARSMTGSLSTIADTDLLVEAVCEMRPAFDSKVVPEMAATMADAPPFALVLDDAHLLSDPRTFRLLDSVMDGIPDGCQFLVASRSPIALRTTRRLIAGDLLDVDAGELAFTEGEARALLERITRGIDPSILGQLARKTGGWAAGLRLLALGLDGTGSSTSLAQFDIRNDQRLADYFHEELLQNLPRDSQRFLLRTGILDQLSGDLCDFVLEADGSAELLEQIVSSGNAFVVPARTGHTFCYHHLFAELLVAELRRQMPQEELHLRRRAVQWHEAHNEPRLAVEHAIASGDAELASTVLLRHFAGMAVTGETVLLHRWVAEIRALEPTPGAPVSLASAWLALLDGDRTELALWMAAANSAPYDGPLPDGSASLDVGLASLRMLAAIGGVAEVAESARTVIDAGPGGGPWAPLAQFLEIVALNHAEPFPDLAAALDQAEFEARGAPAVHTVIAAYQAVCALQRRQLAAAERHIDAAIRDVREVGMEEFGMVAPPFCAKVLVDAARGDVDRSALGVDHAHRLLDMVSDVVDHWHIHCRLVLAEAALLRGEPAAALTELQEAEPTRGSRSRRAHHAGLGRRPPRTPREAHGPNRHPGPDLG